MWRDETNSFAQLVFLFSRACEFQQQWDSAPERSRHPARASSLIAKQIGRSDPSAARAPAARISSSVSLAGADFFSCDLDLRGAGVVDSEASCSEGCGVLLGKLGFFFAGNDYFLRMYFPDENDTAEYCPEKSFQHDAA